MANLTPAELVRKIRGNRTQEEFSHDLGLARPMISEYERGAAVPSPETWMKIGNIADPPDNIYCWERAGLSSQAVTYLLEALANPGKSTPEELKAKLRIMAASPPEPVTEGLAVPPPIGERAKLFDDLVKKYGGPDNLDREKAKALAAALKEAGFMVFGILPTEAETGEAKPAAPAKKAKRQRRQKK